MAIELFQVFVDQGEYNAGEKLKGNFTIALSDTYNHDGIEIKVEGHGMMRWTEQSGCFEDTVAKQQRARKLFYDDSFIFAPTGTLTSGPHSFPFSHELPLNLPSSIQTTTITVWYKVEVLIKKSPRGRREVKLFNIKGQLDLNNYGELFTPKTEIKSKNIFTLSPFLCNLNYVSLGIKIGKRGFLPGECVLLNLAVFSNSVGLQGVSLTLIQELTLTTREKRMLERRTVVKVKISDIKAEDSDDYRKWEEIIPLPCDLSVSSFGPLGVNYFIKLSGEVEKFPYKKISVVIPVTIGSIALKTNAHPKIIINDQSPDISSGSKGKGQSDSARTPNVIIL